MNPCDTMLKFYFFSNFLAAGTSWWGTICMGLSSIDVIFILFSTAFIWPKCPSYILSNFESIFRIWSRLFVVLLQELHFLFPVPISLFFFPWLYVLLSINLFSLNLHHLITHRFDGFKFLVELSAILSTLLFIGLFFGIDDLIPL